MFSNFQIQRIFVERQNVNNAYFNSDGIVGRVSPGLKMGSTNFSSPRVREMSDTSSSESELSDMEMDHIPAKVSRKSSYPSTQFPPDETDFVAREHVQLRFKLMDLWNAAEAKFSFGKFKDCLDYLDQAESLIRETFGNTDNFKLLLAKCLLGKGKAKFKLGDIKKARNLVSESLQLHWTEEGDSILKEIEKMTYFEGLIEISMNNPSSLETNSTNGSISSSLLSTSPYSCFFQKQLSSPPNSPPQKSNHPIYQSHTLSPPLVTNRMDFELLTNGYVSVVHPRVIPLSSVPRTFTQPSTFDITSNPLQQSVNSESSWQQMYLQHQKQQRQLQQQQL